MTYPEEIEAWIVEQVVRRRRIEIRIPFNLAGEKCRTWPAPKEWSENTLNKEAYLMQPA